MFRIFGYECRRLLWNKFFIGLALLLLFYGWRVLSDITILGVSHTPPFSPWSFGDYLSRMLPLLWIGTLFFLTFFTSAKAQRTAVLTNAAPAPPQLYALARGAAALTGSSLLMLICLAEAAAFYGWYFGWYHWSKLLLPVLATLFPLLFFALGSGWVLGQIKSWLIYVWMPLPFLSMALPLPKALGIWNGSFFTDYPLSLGSLDPTFVMPAAVIAAQSLLLAAGVALPALRFFLHRR